MDYDKEYDQNGMLEDESIENEIDALYGSDSDDDTEEEDLIIKFKHPFMFEGKEYKELSLEGLEKLTGADLMAVDRAMRKKSSDVLVEFSFDYAVMLASRATGLPIEFFKALPMKEAKTVRNKVRSFLNN